MMPLCLGLDTSNYTTSVALFDGEEATNLGHLLEVAPGGLGLRQSEALFQHTKHLPTLFASMRQEGGFDRPISAVGASTTPREAEGSYMPCFLAGSTQGQVLSETLGVPFFPCSHQQGHLAAAAWSAGRADLLDRPHLAWHLSGGTTELLLVEPKGSTVTAQPLGGTQDISAGQLIDRTGVLLGLDFPAGRALDTLALHAPAGEGFPVKLVGLTFSLSGMENKAKTIAEKGESPQTVARFVLETVSSAVRRATRAALAKHPGLPVLFSGGVASSRILRNTLSDGVFAPPEYSTDNALGVAILAHRALERGGEHG